jgi:hypothetical protein
MFALATAVFEISTDNSPEPANSGLMPKSTVVSADNEPVPVISTTTVLNLSALDARKPEAVMLAEASTGKPRSTNNSPEPLIAPAASRILTAPDTRLPVPFTLAATS